MIALQRAAIGGRIRAFDAKTVAWKPPPAPVPRPVVAPEPEPVPEPPRPSNPHWFEILEFETAIQRIQRIVGEHFSVSVRDIVSARRDKFIVVPRQIAMYLAKMTTPKSLPAIGRCFGGRDHTTVLHSIYRVEKQMEDPAFTATVALLRAKVETAE